MDEIGIIGLGDMGKLYAREFFAGRLDEAKQRSTELIRRLAPV